MENKTKVPVIGYYPCIQKSSGLFFLFLIILLCTATAQPDVLHPSPCNMERIKRPFPVQAPYIREADMMWSKRVWRVVDLREKLNLPLYYPIEPTVCMMSLFDVLKTAILNNDLKAFANPVFDDEFT